MAKKKKRIEIVDFSPIIGGVLMLIGLFSHNIWVFGVVSVVVFGLIRHSLYA